MVCHCFSFSGQCSTVAPTPGPSTLLNPEFSSTTSKDLVFFFFYQLHIPFTVERCGCLCVASFKLLMKKSDSPSCVFGIVYPHGERMFEEVKSTNRIVHIGFPYTLRGSTFSEFSIMPVDPRGLRRLAFLFQLFFFVSPLKQKWHNSVIRMTPNAWLLFKTRRGISSVWLPIESDCLSIANFSSRQLGFIDVHKTYKL